ncbi:NblA/ycf18 family protein [Pleurocapsales cyanobacterium LEGE 10410]|nr:NblA/ycf18 family protein [Pleurocapsales cyanobacterium LEGE 10410]
MDRIENHLSIEQEFNHQVFASRVRELSREESQDLLIQLHEQMLHKDNIYKQLILNQEKDIVDSLFGARQ